MELNKYAVARMEIEKMQIASKLDFQQS